VSDLRLRRRAASELYPVHALDVGSARVRAARKLNLLLVTCDDFGQVTRKRALRGRPPPVRFPGTRQ
jgi:hypothetical protein